jgi:hypothetical protein
MGIRRHSLGIVFALCVSFGTTAAEYRGFQIDESAQPGGLPPRVMASLQEQLDIVEAVGLPAPVLGALKQTKILVDPDLRGNPGVFSVQGGEGAVRVRPVVFPANKPILLHELLHAYHFSVLSMRNREVVQGYQYAREHKLFPQYQAAHFLENPKEYFAVTGTLYLFGDIQQPPFSCAALANLGPDYLAFLAAQFGPRECHSKAAQG